MTDIIADMGARLARLERRYRRVSILAVGSSLCLCWILLTGAQATSRTSDEIRARRFSLVDDKGREWGSWEVKVSSQSVESPQFAFLTLKAPGSEATCDWTLSKSGGAHRFWLNGNGFVDVVTDAVTTRTGYSKGQRAFSAETTPAGRSFSVFGPENHPRAELAVIHNEPALTLYASNGSVLEKLPK